MAIAFPYLVIRVQSVHDAEDVELCSFALEWFPPVTTLAPSNLQLRVALFSLDSMAPQGRVSGPPLRFLRLCGLAEAQKGCG